ncbi:MAG: cytochrome-c peroxidase [Flavobacteriales bacterium]|nr:cytochrome-c peroxidase [Flavobacteriales bacterium]
MRLQYFHSLFFGWAALVILMACNKGDDPIQPNPDPNWNPTYVSIDQPNWFPAMPAPDLNPTSLEGIALGRRLYYDAALHPEGSFSCSSCHVQSEGFTSNPGGTAVVSHVNLGWYDAFLWNGKIEGGLENIMYFEVNDFFQTDVDRLSVNEVYRGKFFQAFGDSTITRVACSKALAQFVRSMISADAHYDRYKHGNELPTPDEVMGEKIFNSEAGDCFHCHVPPLFTDNSFHNIGLDSVFEGDAVGRFLVSGNDYDKGAFKTPTLRNIALTAPYMHDGRFQTLEEVIDHYNEGVHSSYSLDPIMTKPGKENGLQLSETQKQQLIAFLLSLTDSTYVSNESFSSP